MGKTAANIARKTPVTDHPHGRGENKPCSTPNNYTGGPSPRAWGKRSPFFKRTDHSRTIPTGVGKTIKTFVLINFNEDHPHGRGENRIVIATEAGDSGPSPRAWGKPPIRRTGTRIVRTIPTGVGKTAPSTSAPTVYADHPHGRGENSQLCCRAGMGSGPSPRAWGKQLDLHVFYQAVRTIPTGVGKTFLGNGKVLSKSDHPHGRGENVAPDGAPGCQVGPSPRAWGKHLVYFSRSVVTRTIPTGVGKTWRP